MPSTPDLPGEHPIHFGVVQGAQRGGADLARGMDDAGQRRQLGLHGGEQARDVVRIGDIGRDNPDVAAVLFA